MSNIPVYIMMPECDHEDIILIAIVDMMYQHLKHKNNGNSKRLYRLNKAHTALMELERSYEGCVPEYLGGRADALNQQINKALGMMRTPAMIVRDGNGEQNES